jgi:hypothetical protein
MYILTFNFKCTFSFLFLSFSYLFGTNQPILNYRRQVFTSAYVGFKPFCGTREKKIKERLNFEGLPWQGRARWLHF